MTTSYLEESRDIFLIGEVDAEMLYALLIGLRALKTPPKKPVTIHLYTHGGEFGAALGCYDAIKNYKCPTKIICYGEVYSSGTVILQAGDERIATENCLFMIHHGEVEMHTGYKQAESWMKLNKLMYERMCNIYMSRFTISKKKVDKLLENEDYISASDAKTFGMIDQIL